MPAYKDAKKNTWFVKFQYKNWAGEQKWVTKRGFKTKRDAMQWEREYLLSKKGDLDMRFSDFVEVYRSDRKPRIKDSTFAMKDNIIDTKLIPYFGKKPLYEITTNDVMQWQNTLLEYKDPDTGKPYSKSYLKTIHNQLSAIFNHAVRFYKLKENPAAIVGNMGSEKGIQMKYWTKEEYLKFSEFMMDDPVGYYCFQVLYWCGLREGEMMALLPGDLDFEKKTISVTKTYHRSKGEDVFTDPKTPKSNRVVTMPDFLVDELKYYMSMLYDLQKDSRVFPVTKNYLYQRMDKGCKEQGLTRIRVHDLRHSHVSLLINMGYSAVAIADRMGHESIDITYRYAHLFPTVQVDMAKDLNKQMEVAV